MVIKCDQCQAKFRLDDSKVTEKGVKVRCTKCKHVFTVKKESNPPEKEQPPQLQDSKQEIPSPAEAIAQSSQNLTASSFTIAEEKKPTEEEEEEDFFNTDDFSNFGEEPQPDDESDEGTDLLGKDESSEEMISDDLFSNEPGNGDSHADKVSSEKDDFSSFDDFAIEDEKENEEESDDNEESQISFGDYGLEEEAEEDIEKSSENEKSLTSFGDFDLDGESQEHLAVESSEDEALLASLGDFDLDMDSDDKQAEKLSGLKNSEEVSHTDDNESSNWDNLGETSEENESFGESLENSFGFEAEGEGLGLSDASLPGVDDEDEMSESLSSFDEFDLGDDDSEELEVESSLLPDDSEDLVDEPSKSSIDEPPQREEKSKSFDEYPAKSKVQKKNKAPLMFIFLLLFFLTLGGGLYYLLSTGSNVIVGGVNLQTVITDIQQKMGKNDKQRADIRNLKGAYKVTTTEGTIFVIEGNVVNEYKKPINFIKLKGTLYEKDGQPFLTQAAYAGNMIGAKELLELLRQQVIDQMGYKVGKRLINSNILPGATVPFMIVFYDVPVDLSEFDVELISSEFAAQN